MDKTGTITIKPTWLGLVDALVVIASDAHTRQGRDEGKAELRRMAKIADEVPALLKLCQQYLREAREQGAADSDMPELVAIVTRLTPPEGN